MKKERNIEDELEVIINLPEKERTLKLDNLIETLTDTDIKGKVELIKKRIEFAGNELPGFTASEIGYYQGIFAKEFYFVLFNETYIQHIEDKVRDLIFFIQARELDLKTKQYEFIEDREQDKQDLIEVKRYSKYLQDLLELTKNPPPPKTKTKTEILREKLGELGFFDLPKVEQLSEIGKGKLIELIANNKMPYGIAMFDELGFLTSLDEREKNKGEASFKIAKLYNNKIKDGTNVRHLWNSLIKPTGRYNAKEHKATVRKDYQKLK